MRAKLNAEQRAFMRIWLARSIRRIREQMPETDRRQQMIAALEKDLDRFADPPPPVLYVITGGKAA